MTAGERYGEDGHDWGVLWKDREELICLFLQVCSTILIDMAVNLCVSHS